MDPSNKSVLYIAAAKAYVKKLNKEMEPTMTAIFNEMWASVLDEPRRERLMAFQAKLRAIPSWNQYVISEHKARLVGEKNFPFEDLLTAVFVSRVKVLTAVRMSANSPDITVKVPSLDAFFHRAMFESAKRFYENPTVFKTGDAEAKRVVIHTGIDEAIEDLLPMKAILKAYVGTEVDENANFTPRSEAQTRPDAFYSTPQLPQSPEEQSPPDQPQQQPQQQQQQHVTDDDEDDDDEFLSRTDVIQKIEDGQAEPAAGQAEQGASLKTVRVDSQQPAFQQQQQMPQPQQPPKRAEERFEELFSDAED